MHILPRLDLARPSRRHWLGYLLLAPAVILIAFLIVYPLFISLEISFQNVGIVRLDLPHKPFTLSNYTRLFASPDFWNAAWVTLKLVVIVTAACFVIGLGTALLVNQRFRGRSVARVLIALPWAVPEVIAVVIFSWMFDSSFGLVNWLAIQFHLSSGMIAWLSSPAGAFFVICVVMIWKGYPFVSIMALAGLQAIPDDYYNAARVDGASAWQRLLNITLPSLMPVLGVSLVLSMLWVFRDFSIIYTMTGGGPLHATQTLSLMTYEQAFSFFKMGYASAIGIVTLIICIIASRLMMGRAPDNL
ncbi:carbohydrate ABC transporter membrane protein 1, CUT1 family [Faunimonas pinastri]|uniref:Carbohydrate ABC transporter membrane protein 1, CUT1 family n=1 Tax=Faunimonas pinastri TaxID=1855383 RepID=A0A1H9EHQ1_9HYPH|nr:sugar ABC transporter permease [Faunimonas pinastri]SEQ25112.1 carbohydrate ABC transporter membrane protein 1, CUT1 family [Faunimonas pinastri]